jgi:hypothetical protein
MQYDTTATALNITKAKLLRSKRIEANASAEVDLPSNLIDFYLSG